MSSGSNSEIRFLIVIALKEEFDYFRNELAVVLEPVSGSPFPYYTFRLPWHASHPSLGAVAFLGEMGNESAALATYQLVDHFTPQLVGNIGICGSLTPDVRLGDVVVAESVENYAYRGKIQGREGTAEGRGSLLRFGGRSFHPTDQFSEETEHLPLQHPDRWASWQKDTLDDLQLGLRPDQRQQLRGLELIGDSVQARKGDIASGPFVVASEEFKRELLSHNRYFIAVEMEAAGVLQGAKRHPSSPATIILKGVSDFADERKHLLESSTKGVVRGWALRNALRLFALIIHEYVR